MKERLKFITDQELARNTEPAMVVMKCMRQDITLGRFSKILSKLMILTDSRENVMRYKGSLVFTFGGYDNDNREVYEIEKLRKFVYRLNSEWPYWMWFLDNETSNQFALIFNCLAEVGVIREGGKVATFFKSLDQVKSIFEDQVERSLPLFDTYKIPREEYMACMKDSQRLLGFGNKT